MCSGRGSCCWPADGWSNRAIGVEVGLHYNQVAVWRDRAGAHSPWWHGEYQQLPVHGFVVVEQFTGGAAIGQGGQPDDGAGGVVRGTFGGAVGKSGVDL